MGAVVAGQFSCDACGKGYRWKPELAGRKAKCKCGAVMVCPANEPGNHDDDLFELAPDPVAKAPPVRAASVVLPAAPAPTTSSKTLSYHSDREATDRNFPNKVMDLYAPLIVFAASIAIESVAVLLMSHKLGLSAIVLGTGVAIQMGFVLFCLSIGIFLCAKAYHINLGPLPAAMLKVLAISVAPSAAMDLMYVPLHFLPFVGVLLNWLFGFILYFALLGVFFEMDQEDTWRCVCTIFCIRIAVAIGIVVMPMLMHH